MPPSPSATPRLGDREITCVFGHTDGTSSRTGSLRNDATNLDDDQVTYLKAAHVLNAAMDSAPEAEYVEDDLPGHRAWAGRVADALTEQAGMLRDHQWPAAAETPVADLAEGLEAARKEWADAGRGRRRRHLLRALRQGLRTHRPRAVGHRAQGSGLAVTPPSYDDSGDGSDTGGGDAGIEV